MVYLINVGSRPKVKKKTATVPVQLPPWNNSTHSHSFQEKITSNAGRVTPSVPEPAPEWNLQTTVQRTHRDELISPVPDSGSISHHPYKRIFQPTQYQIEIGNKILPSADEPSPNISSFIQTQMYALSKPLFIHTLQQCVAKVCAEYSILATTMYKNTRILDADIQCFIDLTPFEEIPLDRYVTVEPFILSSTVPV